MHHGDSAYVHAEDVLHDSFHVDLDQTFVKRDASSVKRSASLRNPSASSIARRTNTTPTAVGANMVLGAAATGSVLGAAPSPSSNPFDSRILGAGRAGAQRQPVPKVQPVRPRAMEPERLHVSKTILK